MKPVLPKTNLFFPFLKSWADNGSTNQYSCQLFYSQGWQTLCHLFSKMHIVGEGPGQTPSALRCLSYLISSSLTNIILLRNLYAGQEAKVRTGLGTTDWFQIGKGIVKAVYYHPACLTYMQSTSCKIVRLWLPAMCYTGIHDLQRTGFRAGARDEACLRGAFGVAKFY